MFMTAVAALHALVLVASASIPPQARQAALLQLQRVSRKPAAFAGPRDNPPEINLQGFCKRFDDSPACETQPCCCWSTFAADEHPEYPSPEEVRSRQLCLNPPEDFTYAPDPGLTYDDGMMAEVKKAGIPVYEGRRLCCLRRKNGVQDDSQRDLAAAVPTTVAITTTAAATTEAAIPEPGEVPAAFTTEVVTTSLLMPGDEYENAQMEMAARAHLAAASDLSQAVTALNNGAKAIEEVDAKMQTDPNLVRSRKHVAEMKAAIRGWAERRWVNLKKLASGDAAAFD